jgi:hypothetical protein
LNVKYTNRGVNIKYTVIAVNVQYIVLATNVKYTVMAVGCLVCDQGMYAKCRVMGENAKYTVL